MAYIMDTNEEERAKVHPVFLLMFLLLLKIRVIDEIIQIEVWLILTWLSGMANLLHLTG